MNILIIGNGFDLAHDLPTSYLNFLEFVEWIMRTKMWRGTPEDFKDKCVEDYNAKEYVKDYINSAFDSRYHKNIIDVRGDKIVTIKKIGVEVKNMNPLIQEIYDCLNDNSWYEYFRNLYKDRCMKGINWIDFESEISYIIERIDRYQENLYEPIGLISGSSNKLKYNPQDINNEKVVGFFNNLNLCEYNNGPIMNFRYSYSCKYTDILDKSYKDLRRLIRCMEIYFFECVEKKEIEKYSPDIQKMQVDAVLSFNYTHTFKKLYYDRLSKEINPILEEEHEQIHYIHGKTNLKGSLESNNMVLGIDEYYNEEEKNKYTNFNIFKKFTQRIVNKTGFKHRYWIDKLRNDTNHNIYIFGHSLDITDRDVLKEFILMEGVTTTIFFHEKQQQVQQIANLVKMIGQDKFLEMINSVPPLIQFKEQEEMIPVDTEEAL